MNGKPSKTSTSLPLVCAVFALACAASLVASCGWAASGTESSRTRAHDDAGAQGGAQAQTREGTAPAHDDALSADEESANQLPLKMPLAEPRIVVRKAKRRLLLYYGGSVVRTRRIGLGFNPRDDKIREGDGATPEGSFYVCVKNEKSAYHVSLGLSYPNAEDAARGLRDGLITRAQYKQITNAIKRGRCPSWNTRLGGEIFIHGNGSQSDWTFGCVALEDAEMKELFDAVPTGTPVSIEP